MRATAPGSNQCSTLRWAALLGTLMLVGSLGILPASAAETSPEAAADSVSTTTETGPDSPSVTPPEPTDPQITTDPSESSQPTEPTETPEPSESTEPTEPIDPTTEPPSTDPTTPPPSSTQPSEPGSSSGSSGPSSSSSAEPPAPAPSTTPSKTSPGVIPAPPKPPKYPSKPGSSTRSPWPGQSSTNTQGPRPGAQYGARDARTGFLIDPASGYPIHPKTGLLIEPGTGRMLVRGSLEASDFVYDQATQSVKLSIQEHDGSSTAGEPETSAGAGDGATNVASALPPSTPAQQAETSTGRPSAVMGLVKSPSAPALGLGTLLVLGGLWYFFVFVRQPKPKPQYRR